MIEVEGKLSAEVSFNWATVMRTDSTILDTIAYQSSFDLYQFHDPNEVKDAPSKTAVENYVV